MSLHEALPIDARGVHAVWAVDAVAGLESFAAWPDPPASATDAVVLRSDTVPHPCTEGLEARLGPIDTFARFVLEQLDAFRQDVEAQEPWAGKGVIVREQGFAPRRPEPVTRSWLRQGSARRFVALAAWARFALRGEIVDAREVLRWTHAAVDELAPALHHLVVAGTLGMEPENPNVTIKAFLSAIEAIRERLFATLDARERTVRGFYINADRVIDAARRELEGAKIALMNSGVQLAENTITKQQADAIREWFEQASAAVEPAEAKRTWLVACARVLPDRRFQTFADALAPLTVDDILREAGLLAEGETSSV